MRGLTLAEGGHELARARPGVAPDDGLLACSWFRSRDNAERHAVYSLHVSEAAPAVIDAEHTLAVVREFRRVPLRASTLGLVVFTARAGRAAALVATLAHFAERAVSHYQPAYLLLARSLDEPRLAVLLAGVDEGRTLEAANPSPLSLAALMPEAMPLLAVEPEVYAYCPDGVLSGDARLVPACAV